MNQILRSDLLPERAGWSYLALSGLPGVSRKKNFPASHIINPLLTKLVRSRWLVIIWLQQYARSDWLLRGQDFLVMSGHYENFSRLYDFL